MHWAVKVLVFVLVVLAAIVVAWVVRPAGRLKKLRTGGDPNIDYPEYDTFKNGVVGKLKPEYGGIERAFANVLSKGNDNNALYFAAAVDQIWQCGFGNHALRVRNILIGRNYDCKPSDIAQDLMDIFVDNAYKADAAFNTWQSSPSSDLEKRVVPEIVQYYRTNVANISITRTLDGILSRYGTTPYSAAIMCLLISLLEPSFVKFRGVAESSITLNDDGRRFLNIAAGLITEVYAVGYNKLCKMNDKYTLDFNFDEIVKLVTHLTMTPRIVAALGNIAKFDELLRPNISAASMQLRVIVREFLRSIAATDNPGISDSLTRFSSMITHAHVTLNVPEAIVKETFNNIEIALASPPLSNAKSSKSDPVFFVSSLPNATAPGPGIEETQAKALADNVEALGKQADARAKATADAKEEATNVSKNVASLLKIMELVQKQANDAEKLAEASSTPDDAKLAMISAKNAMRSATDTADDIKTEIQKARAARDATRDAIIVLKGIQKDVDAAHALIGKMTQTPAIGSHLEHIVQVRKLVNEALSNAQNAERVVKGVIQAMNGKDVDVDMNLWEISITAKKASLPARTLGATPLSKADADLHWKEELGAANEDLKRVNLLVTSVRPLWNSLLAKNDGIKTVLNHAERAFRDAHEARFKATAAAFSRDKDKIVSSAISSANARDRAAAAVVSATKLMTSYDTTKLNIDGILDKIDAALLSAITHIVNAPKTGAPSADDTNRRQVLTTNLSTQMYQQIIGKKNLNDLSNEMTKLFMNVRIARDSAAMEANFAMDIARPYVPLPAPAPPAPAPPAPAPPAPVDEDDGDAQPFIVPTPAVAHISEQPAPGVPVVVEGRSIEEMHEKAARVPSGHAVYGVVVEPGFTGATPTRFRKEVQNVLTHAEAKGPIGAGRPLMRIYAINGPRREFITAVSSE